VADGWPAIDTDAHAVLTEAIRVIRPGGRLILLDPVATGGFLGFGRAPAPSPSEMTTRLISLGLRAARLLAEADGIRYFEAVKGRPE